jgi:hypothetical protein
MALTTWKQRRRGTQFLECAQAELSEDGVRRTFDFLEKRDTEGDKLNSVQSNQMLPMNLLNIYKGRDGREAAYQSLV